MARSMLVRKCGRRLRLPHIHNARDGRHTTAIVTGGVEDAVRGEAGRGGSAVSATQNLPQITDLLKEGQEILVQIAKEPIGKKGARITSHIALPGRFLVYMPTVNHTGVSRKIASEEERQRLKRIIISERENGHGGFIVRTAAAGRRRRGTSRGHSLPERPVERNQARGRRTASRRR